MSEVPRLERFPYPLRLVVGLFESEQELQRVAEALERVGFEPDSWLDAA